MQRTDGGLALACRLWFAISGLVDSLILLCCAYITGTCKMVHGPMCLDIPISHSLLGSQHHIICIQETMQRFSSFQELQIPLNMSKTTTTFHHLLKTQGIYREISLHLHFDKIPNLPPPLGDFCFRAFTTLPEAVKTGPDSMRELQSYREKEKSI